MSDWDRGSDGGNSGGSVLIAVIVFLVVVPLLAWLGIQEAIGWRQ